MPPDTPATASPAATEMAPIDALAEASSPVTWAAENLSLEDRDWLRGQLRSIARTEFGRLADLGFTLIHTPDLAALRAERDRLREALAPFAEFAANVEARYRKRGGDPDAFPDTHPFADVTAADLTCGVWRAARAAFAEGRADG